MVNRPITVIAEIGINWQGEMDLAREMIWAAKECGADVAKFQLYVPERILDRERPVISRWWDLICKTELTKARLHILVNECQRAGIPFLTSVFHPDRVEWCEEVGVEWYKVASRSMYDEELARAIHKTKKPCIISYGYYNGYCDALRLLDGGWMNEKHKTLYCVSQYPAPLSEIHLRRGTFFGAGCYDGFSDHTIGITASVVAMSLGAKIIEKHFTMDRKMPGPDHVCSIEPDELHRLCNMRDDIEEIIKCDIS